MPAVVPLRPDFDATNLRGVAKRCPDSRQTRRLLALAAVYDGMMQAAFNFDRYEPIFSFRLI